MLEGVINGERCRIARYSMCHMSRYAYVARILNDLSKNTVPGISSADDSVACPVCGRIYPEGSAVCSRCVAKISNMKRFAKLAGPYMYRFAAAAALFLAIILIQLITPYIYRILINEYIMPMKWDVIPILLLLALLAACQLSSTLIGVGRSRLMIEVSLRISEKLRNLLYMKIQGLSLNNIEKRKTGEYINRMTTDVQGVQNFVTNYFGNVFNQIVTIIGAGVIMFVLNWKLALAVLVPIPVSLLVSVIFKKHMRSLFWTQIKSLDKANSILQDILSGIRVVKVFGQEEKEISRFRHASRMYAELSARNEKKCNLLGPSIRFISGLGQFLLLYAGGLLVLGKSISVGELVQFTQYAVLLSGPSAIIGVLPKVIAETAASIARIFEVLDEEPCIKEDGDAAGHSIEGRIVFKDITFGYQLHEPVLENINLEIAQGEMIGLVGHSGVGKTSLINLVMRFYDADMGQVLIDGIDIRKISQESLTEQIGVVLQETFLFSGTVLDNIRYSKPDARAEEAVTAAMIANAHDFILKLPNGYDTTVGDNGYSLSGGERQRIAIARAILHNPRILILDEATSSLDSDMEQKVQEAMARLIKNRTTIAIAHRLSTLKNADRLVVIDKGRIAETGTHAELLKMKGIYYRMVMAQR